MKQGNFFRLSLLAIFGVSCAYLPNIPIPMPSPSATSTPEMPVATSTPIPTSTSAPTTLPTEVPTKEVSVTPPSLWFWNFGCKAAYKVGPKKYQMDCDSTEWFRMSSSQPCGGAPSCDKDHFGCAINKTACSNQDWDDVRGPLVTASGAGFLTIVTHSNPFGFSITARPLSTITVMVGPRPDFNHDGVPVPVNGGAPGNTKGFLTKQFKTGK